jgi:hypothetical protein
MVVRKVLGNEKLKYEKAKELIYSRTNLESEIVEHLNPISAFGLVHTILSLEYKKIHGGRDWQGECHCKMKKTPHYHYVVTIFDGRKWRTFEKTSLSG